MISDGARKYTEINGRDKLEIRQRTRNKMERGLCISLLLQARRMPGRAARLLPFTQSKLLARHFQSQHERVPAHVGTWPSGAETGSEFRRSYLLPNFRRHLPAKRQPAPLLHESHFVIGSGHLSGGRFPPFTTECWESGKGEGRRRTEH